MHTGLKCLALAVIAQCVSWSASAQAQQDSYVVSIGFGSTLSEEFSGGRATYVDLWSGMVAGRRGHWRPYASVKVPVDQLGGQYRYDEFGNRRARHGLQAVNVGGTYSLSSSFTPYIGGGWTRQRGFSRSGGFGSQREYISNHTANVSVGMLIHTGEYVGINAAIGANPGTASLSANFRF